MGTPVRIIQPGLECGHWEPPAATPIYIYIMFWDMKKGDKVGAREPPNLHIFRLDQDPLSPCDYDHDGDFSGWLVEFNVQAGAYSVNLRDQADPNKIYFLGHVHDPPLEEYHVIVNDFQDPVNNYAWGGFCTVFWMEHITTVATEFGLDHVSDLMFEIFPADPPNLVVKFCSIILRTNVSMKFPI